MSGTSVDGVDCVLVQFIGDQPKLIATHSEPIKPDLREDILQLCGGKNIDLELYGNTDVAIGQLFAQAALTLLANENIDRTAIRAIGSHGQTVFHYPQGNTRFSLQIGDPNSIAHLTRITTIADFRRRDMAAGGEGAPLAPVLHRNCFQSASSDRVVLNVGGIANITVLNKDGTCLAFDTGPANVLMDYWIAKHQQKNYDKNGDWAASGNIIQPLLKLLLDEAYFLKAPPKSTGRELFNGLWLEEKLHRLNQELAIADVQATLLRFTIDSIVNEIRKTSQPSEVYVCGGGVHNSAFMDGLQTRLRDCNVLSTAKLGIDPNWVEAIAFAWMAKQTSEGRTIDTAPFTGAAQATILGGIYKA
ncbi:MAG: anhydro-N-acetylmuramic acid kinase [Gammaproteobacteria bacterium]|nr:anhydro-N-acetylmuramic acid kinase [Gammaproteobacteria bacterium]